MGRGEFRVTTRGSTYIRSVWREEGLRTDLVQRTGEWSVYLTVGTWWGRASVNEEKERD